MGQMDLENDLTMRVFRNLNEAISTMRDFLERAERDVAQNGTDPHLATERLLHQFAWGQANAMSSIENAISYCGSIRRMEKSNVKDN